MSDSDFDDGLDAAEQELVATNDSNQNWIGIAVALLVIALVFGCVLLAIYLVSQKKEDFILGDPITLSQSLTWPMHLQSVRSAWMDDDTLIFLNSSTGNVMQMQINDTVPLTPTIFLSRNHFSEGFIADFTFSGDQSIMALPFNHRKVYRHSFRAQYRLITFSSSNKSEIIQIDLTPFDSITRNKQGTQASPSLQFVEWGNIGTFVAFVYENNVYYTSNPITNSAVKITDTTNNINLTYGIPCWLYEEDILMTNQGVWISPQNLYVAFLRSDESNVYKYKMPYYGYGHSPFIAYQSISYPVAGDTDKKNSNPIVDIGIYQVSTKKTLYVRRPTLVPDDNYVCIVKWYNESHLLVGWLDRQQISGVFGVCSVTDGSCFVVLHQSEKYGWLEFTKQSDNEPVIDASNNRLFTILHNGNYRRIVEVRVTGMNQLRWITPPVYDVRDIVHLDVNQGHLFFTSCRTNHDVCDPTTMHLHRIVLSKNSVTCITCNSSVTKQLCEYNAASFSKTGRYFIHSCLGPDPYSYFLRRNSAPEFPLVKVMEDNTGFQQLLVGKHVPIIQHRQLTLRSNTRDELTVNAKMLMPKQLNESHISQYPLILWVYGGPGAQMVTKKFDFGWPYYLSSSLYCIVAYVDGRGTSNKGSKFLFSLKNKVAKVELEDQMDALWKLRHLQYVNKSSIAVLGWSYGGFLTMHMLGHWRNVNNSYFSTGVAVAPVSDFSYYDTAYTERYLGVKTDATYTNYDRTNTLKLAPNFRNKDFLLIHGTKDDNVHYRNSALMAKALLKENADFDFMTYSDEEHFLTSSHPHLYRKVTTFLLDAFNKTSEKYHFLSSLKTSLTP